MKIVNSTGWNTLVLHVDELAKTRTFPWSGSKVRGGYGVCDANGKEVICIVDADLIKAQVFAKFFNNKYKQPSVLSLPLKMAA